MAASHGSMSQVAGGKSGGKHSRFSRGSSGGASTRPYGSAGDLAGILGGGGGNHGSGDDYHRRSFGSSGVGALDYMEGDGVIDGLDDSSVSVVSSNYSVDDSGSAVCRVESETVMEAGAEGGGSGSPCPKRGTGASAAGGASSGRSRRGGFREGSGDATGEKKVTVRKMAREMEGLKLTCAEMERSQMRTEQQMQAFVTG